MMRHHAIDGRYLNRVGEKTGALTFIGLAETRGDNNRVMGNFNCECGRTIALPAGRVLNSRGRLHCGCKTDRGAHRTHGMHGTPEYSSWRAMKNRCLDPGNKDYPRWGGAGVTVYPEWAVSFDAFYRHIGSRPSGTSLDRIRNNLGYEPGNVRWAFPTDQARNRSSSFVWVVKGMRFDSAQQAADHFRVSDATIHRWVKGAHDDRRGTFTPARENCNAVPKY